MANFTLAVIGMPRNMMCVLVMVLVPTATRIVLMLFMLMMRLVPTAAFIVIMLFMLMMMLLMRSVVITTAAVIVLLCGMLVGMAAAITMAMLRDMPHAAMIVVLATVTTGTAFGMLAIILSPLNVAVYMSKAAHLFRGVTHFF